MYAADVVRRMLEMQEDTPWLCTPLCRSVVAAAGAAAAASKDRKPTARRGGGGGGGAGVQGQVRRIVGKRRDCAPRRETHVGVSRIVGHGRTERRCHRGVGEGGVALETTGGMAERAPRGGGGRRGSGMGGAGVSRSRPVTSDPEPSQPSYNVA